MVSPPFRIEELSNNLANLHVHSKKLSKFKPTSYENYFQSAK